MSSNRRLSKLYARAERLGGPGQRTALANVCKEILKLEPRSLQALQFLSVWHLEEGNHAAALRCLRTYAEEAPDDAGWTLPMVVALESLAKHAEALELAQQVTAKNENDFFPYLYLGSVYEQLGDAERAGWSYSIARELNPKVKFLQADTSLPEAARERVSRSNRLLSGVREGLVRAGIEEAREKFPGADLGRIERAVWLQLDDDEAARSIGAKQQPSWLMIPDLPSPGWFQPSEFEWWRDLEAEFEPVRGELLANYRGDEDSRPYMQKGGFDERDWGGLVGSLDWAACFFYDAVKRFDENCARFPRTSALLDRLPLVTINGSPTQAFFSALKPKTTIPPHYGTSNAEITVHLPLIVPPHCYLKAAGEERAVAAGKSLFFDDTYLHEARNESDEVRIVLLFTVWHPGLSEAERLAVDRCFSQYERWMARRSLNAVLGRE